MFCRNIYCNGKNYKRQLIVLQETLRTLNPELQTSTPPKKSIYINLSKYSLIEYGHSFNYVPTLVSDPNIFKIDFRNFVAHVRR